MDRIELNPEICKGKPVIRGTCITVQTVLSFLSAGDSIEDILIGYLQIKRDDVLACLGYARRLSETRATRFVKRVLVDENLPHSLARILGPTAVHVTALVIRPRFLR